MKYVLYIYLTLVGLASCNKTTTAPAEHVEKTEYKEKLIRDGWTEENISSGELTEQYGYKPVYGIQDNYFDVTMGEGADIALKIVDVKTNQCIRYAYVKENSTITLSQIPQGQYYLKLAYGKDWMEIETDFATLGKFTRGAFYERSSEVYDFGTKNSRKEINYELKINVRDASGMNNFETRPISEEEFMK